LSNSSQKVVKKLSSKSCRQKVVKKLNKSCKKVLKSCQKVLKSCHKVVKICQIFVKIGDNCISIKSRWGWRRGSKSDSTAFGRLLLSRPKAKIANYAEEDETCGRRRRRR
jgi:hypothetical protein